MVRDCWRQVLRSLELVPRRLAIHVASRAAPGWHANGMPLGRIGVRAATGTAHVDEVLGRTRMPVAA